MKKVVWLSFLLFTLFGCANPIEETVQDALPKLFEEAALSPDTEMIHLESMGNRRAIAVFSEPHKENSSYHVMVIERVASDWKLVETINVSNEPLNAGVQLSYLGAGISTEKITDRDRATYLPLPEDGYYLWYTYNETQLPSSNENQ